MRLVNRSLRESVANDPQATELGAHPSEEDGASGQCPGLSFGAESAMEKDS